MFKQDVLKYIIKKKFHLSKMVKVYWFNYIKSIIITLYNGIIYNNEYIYKPLILCY